jgi:Tfp pilus assembly ATPase PilU
MTTIELKKNLHQMIDSVDSDLLLSKFYFVLKKIKNINDGDLWNNLTKEEQDELIISDMESEDENNLISHSEILKKHKF